MRREGPGERSRVQTGVIMPRNGMQQHSGWEALQQEGVLREGLGDRSGVQVDVVLT